MISSLRTGGSWSLTIFISVVVSNVDESIYNAIFSSTVAIAYGSMLHDKRCMVGDEMMHSNIIWSRELVTLTILVSVVISGVTYSVSESVVVACVTVAWHSIQTIQKSQIMGE